ncbi:MAG: hypothetical protein HN350_16875 [Phycisphaerales bacterium]|nr:hypothetical protein [Phycisphaerales bacterium]
MVLGFVGFMNIACVSGQLDSSLRQASQIRYADDENGDYWQSPQETIQRGAGDCEDQAFYLHYLLLKKGLQSEVVFGIEDLKQADSGHVWVEHSANGEVYVLDPTNRMMRARSKIPRHQYYPALDQKLIQTKLEAYIKKTGLTGLNAHYEARIHAAQNR